MIAVGWTHLMNANYHYIVRPLDSKADIILSYCNPRINPPSVCIEHLQVNSSVLRFKKEASFYENTLHLK